MGEGERIAASLKSAMHRLLDRWSISSAVRAPRQFEPAPAALAKILATTCTDATASESGGPIRFDRPVFSERAGVYTLAGSRVLSLPRAPMPGGVDPLARRVHVLSRGLRPVRPGRAQPNAIQLLRQARRAPALPHRRTGRTALLGGYYSDCENYFHYWVDVVADIYFLGQMGHPLSSFDACLLPFSGVAWQREILTLCGLDPGQIVPLSDFTAARPRELVFPVRAKGGHLNPPWLLTAMHSMADWRAPVRGSRRIYLSRRDAVRRPIGNEAEVIERLTQAGFEPHSCSGLTVQQQQALLASASHVVAPHGAALTNLAWCHPGTVLLEFLPASHPNPCFRDLSAQAEIDYHALPCPQQTEGRAVEAGYEVPLERLERWLSHLPVGRELAAP